MAAIFGAAPVSAFFGDVPTTITENGVTINVQGINEGLSNNGVYSATYRYSTNNTPVTFQVETETDRCDEPNGYTHTPRGGCPENTVLNLVTIDLNSSNNYSQDLTLSVTQAGNKPCGSFQTDLRHPYADHYAYATSIYHTGKDLNDPASCNTSTPTPTPTPSVTPTPTPSVTPTPTPTLS